MAFEPIPIFETLEKHGVDYVVVGGLAGILHGSPMPTEDVDIVPDLKRTNLDRLAAALKDLDARIMSHAVPEGIPMDLSGKDLQRLIVDTRFFCLQTRYGRLDLIHRPAGTEGYQDLAPNAEELNIGDVEVRVAALEDIVRSKQAVARDRDLEQLPTLRLLLEAKREELRPGQTVIVPWNLGDVTGVVEEVHGVGSRATVMVSVDAGPHGRETLPFPASVVRPA